MRRLLVFLKYPTPGQVKTRLAAHLGDEAAAEIYRACAELTLLRLRAFQKEIVLCVDPPEAMDEAREWLGSAWTLRPQHGLTLGERLSEAMGDVVKDGAQRVIVIGTDSPWLSAPEIEQAFAALERTDVVIGPTEDGGYYLLGLAKPVPELFEDIPWSTSGVYQRTLEKVRALGLHAHPLRRGYDVDRLEDLHRFIAEETGGGTTSTHVKLIEVLSRK